MSLSDSLFIFFFSRLVGVCILDGAESCLGGFKALRYTEAANASPNDGGSFFVLVLSLDVCVVNVHYLFVYFSFSVGGHGRGRPSERSAPAKVSADGLSPSNPPPSRDGTALARPKALLRELHRSRKRKNKSQT